MQRSEGCPFAYNENVDCLDTVNKWLNAEVQKIDTLNRRVFVHYTGFSTKYDEWMSYAESPSCKRRI